MDRDALASTFIGLLSRSQIVNSWRIEEVQILAKWRTLVSGKIEPSFLNRMMSAFRSLNSRGRTFVNREAVKEMTM